MGSELRGRALLAGSARGRALVLPERVSFAMGFDPVSGQIRDPHGGSTGASVRGRVLVMDGGRGSSSASTSLAEAIRLGTAPAAILLSEVDEILAVGAIVARRLYGRTCPMVVLSRSDHGRLADGGMVSIGTDGRVRIDG